MIKYNTLKIRSFKIRAVIGFGFWKCVYRPELTGHTGSYYTIIFLCFVIKYGEAKKVCIGQTLE